VCERINHLRILENALVKKLRTLERMKKYQEMSRKTNISIILKKVQEEGEEYYEFDE
jgi:hypothetical protein